MYPHFQTLKLHILRRKFFNASIPIYNYLLKLERELLFMLIGFVYKRFK